MLHFDPMGVLEFDIQTGTGDVEPRVLNSQRPLKPPPASAAVTPRTGRSPAPAPFNLRRRSDQPDPGDSPHRESPASCALRPGDGRSTWSGRVARAAAPAQPSPAQPSPARRRDGR